MFLLMLIVNLFIYKYVNKTIEIVYIKIINNGFKISQTNKSNNKHGIKNIKKNSNILKYS